MNADFEAAARLLSGARLPVIAGLGTDVAGAQAAIRLAERLRGAIDHSASEGLLRHIRILQDFGTMFTTPAEAGRRGDLFVIVGGFNESSVDGHETLRLSSDRIGRLRARLNGRRAREANPSDDDFVVRLKKARFGVFVFDPDRLDALTLENLCGLTKELNEETRFSMLRPLGSDSVDAVNEASLWLTGGPLRVGFGRGRPEHDPWLFEATRMVDSGEADAALWIAAIGDAQPKWSRKVPLVALVRPDMEIAADVRIEVGRPGLDHDGVLTLERTGALGFVQASAPTNAPTVAQVLDDIFNHIAQQAAHADSA